MFVTRNVWMKYRAPAGDGTGDAGDGSGSGASDDGAAAAALAAEAAKGNTEPPPAAKPKLSDEEAKLIKEVMDKKTKLKEAADKIAALEATVKQFDGIDADGVRKLLSEKQAEETRKLEEKGQWDSLKKQMVEEFGKEKVTLSTQVAERDTELSALKGLVGDLTVGNAFASSTFIKEDMTMPVNKARALYGNHFEFKDGSVVAYDKPAGSSDRNVLVDSKGDPLSFEYAIKKIIDSDPDRDLLLKSKVKPGAGSKTSNKSSAPDQRLDKPSGMDMIAAAISKGALNKK